MGANFRPDRILAIARRDVEIVTAGRGRWRLLLLAAGLLLPLGAIPVGLPEANTSAQAGVRLGPGLDPAVGLALLPLVDADAARTLAGTPPRLSADSVPASLRQALDTHTGAPTIEVRLTAAGDRLPLPGRMLLAVLVAVSLLTGPLAESLPGERSRGTLDVLLTASVHRGEIVLGKWLAWTSAASLAAILAGVGGLATGALQPGPWPLGVVAAVAVTVAIGLWLLRGVGDVVAGATAPMRVIPVVATGLAGLAWAIGPQGALVPLGGALLVAGDSLRAPLPVAQAIAGSALATAALLAATTRALSRESAGAMRGRRDWGLAAAAALAWWLPVAGPTVWAFAGNDRLIPDPNQAWRTGGLLCLLLAAVAAARLPATPPLDPLSRLWSRLPGGWAPTAVLAVMLAVAVGLTVLTTAPGAGTLNALSNLPQPEGGGWLALGLAVIGQEALFRGALPRQIGALPALLIWVVVVGPGDPAAALGLGLLLLALAARVGWAKTALLRLLLVALATA